MPALPPVPGVLKCVYQHLVAGVNVYVHAYYRYAGTAPLPGDAAAIANSLKSSYNTNFIPLCHPNVIFQLIQVTDLASATGAQGSSAGTLTGTRTGGPLTANDCLLQNLKMARRYRGGKPRQYWPFGTDTDVLDPQHWTTAFITAVGAAWNANNSAAGGITWAGGNIIAPCNVSYYQGFTVVTSPTTGRARNVPKPRATPVVDTITSGLTSSRIATQRRRQHFSA